MLSLIIGGIFLLAFLVLLYIVRFPMESRIRELERGIKRAMEELDHAKGRLAELKKGKRDTEGVLEEVEKAAEEVERALARQRDEGGVPQVWAMMGALCCSIATTYFVVLGLLALLHPAAAWAWFFLIIIAIGYYIFDIVRDFIRAKDGIIDAKSDINIIQADEVGIKMFMGKPYTLVSSGPRYAPSLFVHIVHIPTRVLLYKLREDNVMSGGDESTPWTLDITIRYRLTRDVWNLVRYLGTDVGNIISELTGATDEDGKRTTRGIIGDELTAIARAWIGNPDNIKTIDEGLKSQENIAGVIDQYLELALRHIGVSFEYPDITDFDPTEQIRKARADRTEALIGVGKAKQVAKQREAEGKGESEYLKAIAEADAFRAEKIIKQKISALSDMSKNSPDWVLSLLSLLVIGEEGLDKLKDAVDLKLISLEGLGGALESVGTAIAHGGGEKSALQILSKMPAKKLEELIAGLGSLAKKGGK